MEKECLSCGESFDGRSDKKYCSDYCRNSYNNKLNSGSNNYIRKVNRILKNNRRILEELNPTGKTKVKKQQLLAKGFVFNYMTSVYVTKKQAEYKFCYEYGYLDLGGEWYALVIKKEYAEEIH